jgi:transcriptional regulator with XRE-family HTH domain
MTPAPGIEQLRRELVERRWSEQDLADRIQQWAYLHGEGTLGITRSYVSEWLNGRRGVSAPYARRIQGVTGIPADQFIDRRSVRARELEEIKRRNFLRVAGTAAAAAFASLPETQDGTDSRFGFVATTERSLPSAQLTEALPDHGISWNLHLPGGQAFDGATVAVQLQSATGRAHDRVVLDSSNRASLHAFLQTPRRGLIVGAEEIGGRVRYFGLDAREARHRPRKRPSFQPTLTIPQAFELDDLTFGILWALANLDDALSADDLALDEEVRELHAYEALPSSAVSREVVMDLTTVSQMWLGSSFCARHILRNLDGLAEVPLFWTREQCGEEASTWLLFKHKYDYLRATGSRFAGDGTPLVRGFCVPEKVLRSSPRFERAVFFLSVALMESLGIQTMVCVEPEYSNIDGFVLAPGQEAIIANWVRSEGVWQVDKTARRSVLQDFAEAAGHVQANSVTAAPTPAGRLLALARYLDLDWDWLRRRCMELGGYGCGRLVGPRNRLMSTAALDAVCHFVGELPADKDRTLTPA